VEAFCSGETKKKRKIKNGVEVVEKSRGYGKMRKKGEHTHKRDEGKSKESQ